MLLTRAGEQERRPSPPWVLQSPGRHAWKAIDLGREIKPLCRVGGESPDRDIPDVEFAGRVT